MSSFNILKIVQACNVCGEQSEIGVQFKYGSVWQLEYRIGDSLKWDGNNIIGEPGHKCVVVDAVADSCPLCGADGYDCEIWIKDNVIARAERATGNYNFLQVQRTYVVVEE